MGLSLNSRCLYRSKPSKLKMPRIGTFDIETDGLGGEFILGAICDDNDSVTPVKTIPELIERLLSRKSRGITWYAHNGGNYDFKYLINHLVSLLQRGSIFDLQFIETNAKFIQIQIYRTNKDKNPLCIRDSYALIPAPLAQVSKTFAPQYIKGHINFEQEQFDPQKPEHINYLYNDVLGLRHSLLTFFETCREHFGIVPSLTAASTAIKAWKRTIPEDDMYWRVSDTIEAFIRDSYFGGMVYLKDVNITHENMVKLDISGAYGYAMKTYAMPVGTAIRTDEYEPNAIGFYKVKVTAPEHLEKYIVGKKTKSGVIWARGTFYTTIDSYTLEYARKRGYIIDVIEGYYFNDKKHIFKEFIEKCELLEFKNKGNALGDTAKLMRNSLYGKFGTNPNKIEYGINKSISEGWEPFITEEGTPHDYLYTRNVVIDASYIMPHWASTITALVRRYLDELDALLEYSFVYNDTDSSVVPQEIYEQKKHLLPSQVAYGRFKVETLYDMFLVKGAKAYIGKLNENYIDQNGNVIEYDMKAKGIPRRLLTPDVMFQSGSVPFRSLNGIIPMMRDGKGIPNDISRTVTDIRNSHSWEVFSDNSVLPLRLDEDNNEQYTR